jgi:phosphopantothenoylcysteine decarboxylase/phosphopantothenate--cysteine ligase
MCSWKRGKNILFCVTGGIAAYKMPEVVHTLVKEGNTVRVLLTKAAEKFVTPFLFATLTKERVFQEEDFLNDATGWTIPHVSLAAWADLLVIAPCTANSLKVIARGESHVLLGALFLASPHRGLLFPSMNTHMWEHPMTALYARECADLGHRVVEPGEGRLACGTVGKGKMQENSNILEEIWRALAPKRDFAGKRVLVTAGPTWEYLDPVRFLSNPSSGKMGYALAREAWYRGAEVTFLSGPLCEGNFYGFRHIPVVSAQEMEEQMDLLREEYDILFMAAAVGDYRFQKKSSQKIKRGTREILELALVQNPDLLAKAGMLKKDNQILVGFAAETENLLENASEKLRRKHVDYIVANPVGGENSAFASSHNSVTIIGKEGKSHSFGGTKAEVAAVILDSINSWPE